MKRKIAAILVAHIAEYGRLVADDEEETLRRLASGRSATDDFIAIAGGRIFNAPGDAVLAEFPSAVEAVRCAIDIQESMRTRNLAFPDSRQMFYRIGIGIGDVVVRDGDLLGDGVNIAARLEGLAEVGGICISRAVHEQVEGKLSARFIDIGARMVKNIPAPVHAYLVATWQLGRSDVPLHATAASARARSSTPWLAVALVGAVALGTATLAFVFSTQMPKGEASNLTAAAALPPVSTTPAPPSRAAPSSAPPSSTPAIRRTSSATSEPEVTKRSFEFCSDLAAERGWGANEGWRSANEATGRRAFVTACMKSN
jgi:class 3 adenylate cyclase